MMTTTTFCPVSTRSKWYLSNIKLQCNEEMADIITLDRNLKKQLRCMNKLPEMKKRLFKLEQLLATAKTLKKNRQITILEMSCSKLREDIHDIELADALQMYTIETVEIIEKFKKILARPVQMSFMGPIKVDTTEKDNLVKRYMSIYNRYMKKINCNPPEQVSEAQEDNTSKRPKQPVVCSVNGCTSTKFSVVDQLRVCERCSTVQSDLTNPTSSYSDIDRINISSKYLYDRKIHFRDCILQFQGRQNVTIDKSVYDALENEFEKHHLLIGDSNTPIHIRFSKITKEHISIFLKELRLSKHYENVQLIHYNLTGIAPPDISHLEGALLQDFEKLTALYDDIHKKDTRKNFINTAYVLYQLLRRHKFDCDAGDFSILKTSERRDWHHRICRNLFSILNWNFSAI